VIAHNSKGKQTDDPQCLAFRTEHREEPEHPFGPLDETTYLLQSEANRKQLLTAIENIDAGRNLVEVLMDM
jgi:hypothetical protein